METVTTQGQPIQSHGPSVFSQGALGLFGDLTGGIFSNYFGGKAEKRSLRRNLHHNKQWFQFLREQGLNPAEIAGSGGGGSMSSPTQGQGNPTKSDLLQANTAKEIAKIQADAQMYSADAQAGASTYGANMQRVIADNQQEIDRARSAWQHEIAKGELAVNEFLASINPDAIVVEGIPYRVWETLKRQGLGNLVAEVARKLSAGDTLTLAGMIAAVASIYPAGKAIKWAKDAWDAARRGRKLDAPIETSERRTTIHYDKDNKRTGKDETAIDRYQRQDYD